MHLFFLHKFSHGSVKMEEIDDAKAAEVAQQLLGDPLPQGVGNFPPLSQDGARAEDLFNDNTGVLRLTRREQKSRVKNKVKSQLD